MDELFLAGKQYRLSFIVAFPSFFHLRLLKHTISELFSKDNSIITNFAKMIYDDLHKAHCVIDRTTNIFHNCTGMCLIHMKDFIYVECHLSLL